MKQNRYFEWIKGEDTGKVETLDYICEFDDEIIYNFVGGESCNQRFISKVTSTLSDLKEKFMVEVNSPSNVWTVAEVESKQYKDHNTGEVSDIPTLHDILNAVGSEEGKTINDSDLGTQTLVAPKRKQAFVDLPHIEDYPEPVSAEPVREPEPKKVEVVEPAVVAAPVVEPTPVVETVQPVQVNAFDPVKILTTTCKKNPTEINLTLNIKLPNKAIYQIAENNFEDGGKKFIDFIVDDIDTSILIDTLKESLLAAYSEQSEN